MPKTHWLEYVKEAAVQAVLSKKPCDYIVGTVTSAKPLKIKLSEGDGLVLSADFIHLAQNVTDYTLRTDSGNIHVNNALKKGDRVLMVRKWGGQDYIVIDKVVK